MSDKKSDVNEFSFESLHPINSDETIDLSKDETIELSDDKTAIIEPSKKKEVWIGDYRIIKELGRGGMGSFNLARREKNNEKKDLIEEIIDEVGLVVPKKTVEQMKTLYNQKTSKFGNKIVKKVKDIPEIVGLKVLEHPDEELLKRFENEFNDTMDLRHNTGVMDVFEFGFDGDKVFYSAEILPGDVDKHVSLEDAIEITRQVCETLENIHPEKWHRDLKPDNIRYKIDDNGKKQYKLTDFGIAKTKRNTNITIEGSLIGTPLYMSPEQALGEKTDYRTDIFSLGVILYKWITGKFPTWGVELENETFRDQDHMDRFLTHLGSAHHELDYLPSEHVKIDKSLEGIILKALAKDKSERYQTCGEIKQDIEHYLKEEKVSVKNYRQKYLWNRWKRKNGKKVKKPLIIGLITLFTSLTCILGYNAHLNNQGKEVMQELKEQKEFFETNNANTLTELLALEDKLDETIKLTKKAVKDYKGKSYELRLESLEEQLLTEKKELQGKILNKSIEKLRSEDSLNANFELVLEKLCTYKLKHLMNVIPENKIPDITKEGKYRFTDLSRDCDNSYYPSMLRLAYEITGDESFFSRFEHQARLINESRNISNASVSEFYDYLLLLKPFNDLRNDLISRTNLLLTRFMKIGEFFRAVDPVDSILDSKGQLQNEINPYLTILPEMFKETGNLDYWNLYQKHMETSLASINEDGSVPRVIGFAQNNKEFQGKQFQKGEPYYTVGFRDWRNENDLFALTHPMTIISFIENYKLTNDERFLESARKIADFMIKKGNVWNWNLGVESEKDSFTTVMMANAFLDLSLWETDLTRQKIYYSNAKETLKELTINYLNTDLKYEGLIKGVQVPDKDQFNISTSAVDYFYLKALQKLNQEKFPTTNLYLTQEVTTSGFLREKTGSLAIEDRTIMQVRFEDKLYFDFKCYSPNFNNEQLEIILDLNDNKDFYTFRFNPHGIKIDGIGPDHEELNDFNWNVNTEINEGFWSASVEILIDEINNADEFDFNVYRTSSLGNSSFGYAEKYFRNLNTNERKDLFLIKNNKIKK